MNNNLSTMLFLSRNIDMQLLTELKIVLKDKKVDIIDKNKIPKLGIHILSGLNMKKINEIIIAKGNLVVRNMLCKISKKWI